LQYKQIEMLKTFLGELETTLLSEEKRTLVTYPSSSISPWNTAELDAANQKLLYAASGDANVYAIFTAPKNSISFSLRYIGKTTRKLARQRIRNHLIRKHEKTGAKLKHVMDHVLSGGSIKISWIKIEPESLRNYVEEELIHKHQEADWNRENAQSGN